MRASAQCGKAAFTLVELMIVVFILLLLVTLAVSAGRYIILETGNRQTIAWEKTIRDAVDAYYLAERVYPVEMTTIPAQPTAGSGFWLAASWADSINGVHWQAYWRSHGLFTQLNAEPASREKLGILSSEVIDMAVSQISWGGGTCPAPGAHGHTPLTPVNGGAITNRMVVKDAWGMFLDYRIAGGLGGTPVIISAGPDKIFDNWTGASGQGTDRDNVRSDAQ